MALLWLVLPFVATALPQSEIAALGELYNATHGSSWRVNTDWLSASTPACDWFGVSCDSSQGTVTYARLRAFIRCISLYTSMVYAGV